MTFRRNILITGCASGIGRHLATVFGENGHWVMATDVDDFGLAETADDMEWQLTGIHTDILDVTNADGWRRVVEQIRSERGRLDLLVNVAGYLHPGYVFETPVDEIERQIDVNLKGTMFGTRIVGEAMVEQGSGHIVNFGSLASLAPVPGIGVYTGTKFGVRGFSLAAAQELRERGVDLTLIMPDAVDTPMLDKEADFKEAAVTFSGSNVLTVEQIADVMFDRVLPDRPLEVTLPPSRGGLAKLTGLVPDLLRLIHPIFRKIGLRRQEQYKGSA